MAMSTDRVTFFLPYRYFSDSSNGMTKPRCRAILLRAFDMTHCESELLMEDYPNGFWIVCRPSQFARFIVDRHETGHCINGIRDLTPKIIGTDESDFYGEIALVAGVDRNTVRRVALALSYSGPFTIHTDRIDVSKREYKGGC